MGIRFTDEPVVFTTLRADTSAHLRSDLNDALLLAGWILDRLLSNGAVYQIISPQDLRCHCRIQDTGGTESGGLSTTLHYVDIQFMSEDETRVGVVHHLIYGGVAYTGYQIVAGICYMFISMPGVTTAVMTGGHKSNSLSGGIPAISSDISVECSVEGAPIINELWWSESIDPISDFSSFRSSRFNYASYSFCKNGVLTLLTPPATEGYETSPLQLIPLTPTNNIDFWPYTPTKVSKYSADSPLVIDAFLGFRWQIVGHLYNAFMYSRDTALEDIVTSTEVDEEGNTYTATWLSYNYGVPTKGGGGTWFATLYLLVSFTPLETESNYVY